MSKESKVTQNRKKAKKGNKRYWSKHKLSRRETNFRIWLEDTQHVHYGWYRTLPPKRRSEFRQKWYDELETTGKSPLAKLPKKYR